MMALKVSKMSRLKEKVVVGERRLCYYAVCFWRLVHYIL